MLMTFTFFVGLTALLHLLFFKLESIDFMKSSTLKKFGLNPDQGAIVKIWAFNQGFYNLFLALGLLYSLVLVYGNQFESGIVLARFILLTVFGAGLVLLASAPKKFSAALVQGIPALIGFVLSFLI